LCCACVALVLRLCCACVALVLRLRCACVALVLCLCCVPRLLQESPSSSGTHTVAVCCGTVRRVAVGCVAAYWQCAALSCCIVLSCVAVCCVAECCTCFAFGAFCKKPPFSPSTHTVAVCCSVFCCRVMRLFSHTVAVCCVAV